MFRQLHNFIATCRIATATGRREHRKVIDLATGLETTEPEQRVWQVLKARAQKALGEEEQAAETWRRVLSAEPDNFDALTELTGYYLRNNQPEVACEAIRRALKTQDVTTSLSLSRLDRWILKMGSWVSGKNLERDAIQSSARRQRWRKRWRAWAERFLVAHASKVADDEKVN